MKTKTITTYLEEDAYLAMKRAADASGMKIWRIIQEGVYLWIAKHKQPEGVGLLVQPHETLH